MMRFKRILTALCMIACIFSAVAMAGACVNTQPANSSTIYYETGVEDVTVPPLTANVGSKIYPPADPYREGYIFEGWELDGQPFTFDVMPDTDVTLTAKWNELFSISFDTGTGATQISDAEYLAGEAVTQPENPVKDGYKFDGWSYNGEPFDFSSMPAQDVTLTALWVKAYTITFSTGTAEYSVAPLVEVAGEAISAPAVHRPNYYLKSWKLNGVTYDFTVMPEANITLTAEWVELTNLPSMFINLSDKSGNVVPLSSVNRETYVNSVITLTNTDEEYELNNLKSEFKGRGNGSWGESKKGYKIKFDKKQSIFGREANKHWVIIACTNFDDVTMSRNYLAYNMAGELFTNIEYSTEAWWIDVYVNDEYRGVYLLCEHVRVGDGRVDIESEYAVDDTGLDTGYLVEYDAYATGEEGIDYFRVPGVKYAFTVHSPDPEEYSEETTKALYQRQVKYIKDYVTQVYNAALSKNFSKFSELADVNSFVDMYILHELFKNVDTGYSSFFLYKKAGGKLYAGPPWDFDATANIGDRGDRTPQGIYVADAVQSGSPYCASELYIALYNTAGFKNAVKARWKQLSPEIRVFLDENLNDEVYEEYKVAMGKNFALWKGKSQKTAENDWVRDIKTLKQWLLDRITWLDNEWK